MPALATATSRPPKRSTELGDGGHHRALVGDVAAEADRPRPIRSAASLACSASRSRTATEAPRRCSWRAVSKPIPRAAPVTSATLPLRSKAGPCGAGALAAGTPAPIKVRRCPRSSPHMRPSPPTRGLEPLGAARARAADAAAGRVQARPVQPACAAASARRDVVVGQLAYTRNKTFRFNVALARGPRLDRVRAARSSASAAAAAPATTSSMASRRATRSSGPRAPRSTSATW